MGKPIVTIIIANYNGEQYLDCCLESIIKSNFADWTCLLIDDGSTDNSASIIEKYVNKDKRFNIIKNEKNIGAAASRNEGIRVTETEFVIFLDNDTEVDENWILPLIEPMEKDSSIGGVQSTLIDFNNRSKIQLTGVTLQPHTCWGIPIQKNELVKNLFTEQRYIVALSAALAMRTEIAVLLNGFDEKLAVYTEDLEFSLRIWIGGYKIVNCPDSIVYHWTKTIDDRKNMFDTKQKIYFHISKNTLRTIIKNYSTRKLIIYLPLAFLILVARSLIVLILKKDLSSLVGTYNGIIWNIIINKDTIQQRNTIQNKIRKVNDNYIFDKVFSKESLWQTYQKYYK